MPGFSIGTGPYGDTLCLDSSDRRTNFITLFMSTQIAWAAGLFEGEGCIHFDKQSLASVKISMTDYDIVQRFADIFDLKVNGPYSYTGWRSHHKPCWVVKSKAQSKVRSILNELLPYFGSRRAHKALDILDYLECK